MEESNEYLVDVRIVIDGEVLHARCSLNDDDVEEGKIADWMRQFKKSVEERC